MIFLYLLLIQFAQASEFKLEPDLDKPQEQVEAALLEDHPGAQTDSNGRVYELRIEKRVVGGLVVWRTWQQYLDVPESTAWADYEPPVHKKKIKLNR